MPATDSKGVYSDGAPLTQEEIAQVRRLLSDPLAFPQTFKNWILAWVVPELSGAAVIGAGSVIETDRIADAETQAGPASYDDLSTVGPTVSDLPKGTYLMIFGAIMSSEAGGSPSNSPHHMSISINGDTASDDDACWHRVGEEAPVISVVVKDLTETTNTVECKYRSGDASNGTWQNRYLIVIRQATI